MIAVNAPHDLGGRTGFGAVPRRDDGQAVFAEDWHARALALTVAAGGIGAWNIDASRHSRERLGDDYDRYSYYERWLGGLAKLLVERGLASREEIAAGRMSAPLTDGKWKPLEAERTKQVLRSGGPSLRATHERPLFAVGQKVRTRGLPEGTPEHVGHTRLPAYAAGCAGRIVMDHGAHVLPDSNAHFRGEAPEQLYCVSFGAADLWSDANPRDEVRLDLWQSYLIAE